MLSANRSALNSSIVTLGAAFAAACQSRSSAAIFERRRCKSKRGSGGAMVIKCRECASELDVGPRRQGSLSQQAERFAHACVVLGYSRRRHCHQFAPFGEAETSG